MKLHKHAELIKAWADGAEIEARFLYDSGKGWAVAKDPNWNEKMVEFRIKPEPKPDVVHFWRATSTGLFTFGAGVKNNLELTFDGETGELKSAEVIE